MNSTCKWEEYAELDWKKYVTCPDTYVKLASNLEYLLKEVMAEVADD